MKRRNKINRNNLGNDRQPQAVKGDEEQEQNEGQRDIGLLEVAGRTIWQIIENRIGVKKIDESDENKKIKEVDKKNFPDAKFFHRIKL